MNRLKLVTVAVAVVGVLITAAAGLFGLGVYQRQEAQKAITQTENAAAAVELAMDRVALAVHAVRALYAADLVTRDQFLRFASRLTALQGIRSLGFYRRVEQSDRQAYENGLQDEPASTLGIWQYDADGNPSRAAERPVYYPLEAAVPTTGIEPTYGLDVASLPGREQPITEAIERYNLVASDDLGFNRSSERGVVLYAPVADRNGKIVGVAAGTVALTQLINTAALASGNQAISIDVGEQWLAAGEPPAIVDGPGNGVARSFAFGGRIWTVSILNAGASDPIGRWLVVLVVGAGLAATLAAVAYVVGLSKTKEADDARSRLRGMLDGLGPLAWLLAPDGTIQNANRSAVTLFKRRVTELVGVPLSKIVNDDADRAQITHAVEDAATGTEVRFDLTVGGEDVDKTRILDFWVRPLIGERGQSSNLVASAVDVTDRYEAQETQRLLMRELDHRMKNTLQVIQAVIRRTAKAQSSIATFEDSLLGRVGAMSRAHDLLAQERWLGANIHMIVEQETGTFDSGRAIRSSGPPLRLNPRAALSIAMAIHELGTNASKYGALASPEGIITVEWAIDREGDEPQVCLTWRESGGPPVERPKRQGFGSMVIERSIAYELDGNAMIDYRPEGLVCTISVPLRMVRPFAADVAKRPTMVG